MVNHRWVLAAAGVWLLAALQSPTASADEKLQKKVEKLDARLVGACADLAKKYDELKDPEAAHFFASCAVGFGSKDDKILGIKNVWEIAVFIGKVRGGKPLADAEPISTALRGLSQEYRAIRDALWTDGVRGNLGDASKRILRDSGVKMELTQNAGEYVKTVQRFNALRQSMGLRAVFWDFEASSKLVGVAWYMAQTGDYEDDPGKDSNKDHVCYTVDVEDARKKTSRMPNLELAAYPEYLRHFSLIREDLINPNARRIWLAHWGKGWALHPFVMYAIPQLPYREDIPTPGARFKDETVTRQWDGWVDVEETITIAGKKVPFVRYPFEGETDAPRKCYGGETGWQKSEYKALDGAGTPIICRFFINTVPTDVDVQLSLPDGKNVPYHLYLNGDKRVRLHNWATVLAIPETPLEPRTKCNVKMKCTLEGAVFEKTWAFTVGAE
jgi:hypothetical protein